MISESLEAIKIIQAIMGKRIRLAINISSRQIASKNFIGKLENAIQKSQVDPRDIEFEITESYQLESSPETIEIIQKIRKLGISIAVDDYGTGYSSLYYLKKLTC